MDGIAGVQARIQDIVSQFQGPRPAEAGGRPRPTDFASVLAQAQSPTSTRREHLDAR